jgi:hypothetical protein
MIGPTCTCTTTTATNDRRRTATGRQPLRAPPPSAEPSDFNKKKLIKK